jgi:uncharacterized protein YfkK (UPF0435 family)
MTPHTEAIAARLLASNSVRDVYDMLSTSPRTPVTRSEVAALAERLDRARKSGRAA